MESKPEQVPIPFEEAIPLKQAARTLRVSYKTVCRWQKSGKLLCRRVGSRYVTSLAALEAACPYTGSPAQLALVDRYRDRAEVESWLFRVSSASNGRHARHSGVPV